MTAEAFAFCLLAAAGLQAMENLLPRIPLLPWLRLGLSHAILLPVLLRHGTGAAVALLLARNGLALLIGGQPFTTFLIGSGAGLSSLLAFGPPVRWALARGWLGLPAAGALLATAFNAAQLLLVKALLIRHAGFLVQAGPLLAWSLLSGAATAWLAGSSWEALGRAMDPGALNRDARSAPHLQRAGSALPGRGNPLLAALALSGLLAAAFAPWAIVQAGAVPALLLLAGTQGRRSVVSAWPFFLFLAGLHLWCTPGILIPATGMTREGLQAFAFHAFRLANLLLLGRLIGLHLPWSWVRSGESAYLRGLALAIPLIPATYSRSLETGRRLAREAWAGKRTGLLDAALETWHGALRDALAGPGNMPVRAPERREPAAGAHRPRVPAIRAFRPGVRA